MDVKSIYFVPLLTAPIIVLAGFVLFYFPPKNINAWYGYRSPSSMKSKERWDFAQTYSGIWMMVWGAVMGLISGLGYLMLPDILYGKSLVGTILMLIFIVIPILQTELRIKKRFGKGGR